MLNNKGQSLVLFVLILPIIFIVMMIVVDVARMILLRQELNNVSYIALDYGLEVINEEDTISKVKELINKNNSDINNVSVEIKDDIIYVNLEDNVDLMFIKSNLFMVRTSYLGYIEDDKKIIERDK